MTQKGVRTNSGGNQPETSNENCRSGIVIVENRDSTGQQGKSPLDKPATTPENHNEMSPEAE